MSAFFPYRNLISTTPSNVKILSGNLSAYSDNKSNDQRRCDAPASLLLLKHFEYLLITDLFPFKIGIYFTNIYDSKYK